MDLQLAGGLGRVRQRDDLAKPMGEGWTVTDFETHVRDEYTTFGWIIERMLEEAGFVVETVERSSPVTTAYVCRKKCSS
ncbi:hypothetical protein [Leptolyngbya sp. 7M]|uniref:hypothetical protein n=1 Tax=Leptolyngbya sp. 7M TaxID=2812896 RepID=UPI001B8AAD01|nr:hypothetical protein [Leptolyngbya sp. 7M]QYO64511.1 hypothetical protein JVX88_33400 [Leptolyngbya sp. 7M]